MSEHLAAAAAALGAPEELVERSARARAAAAGVDADTILAAWAGGTAAPSAPSPTPAPEPEVAPAPAADTTAATPPLAADTAAAAPAPAAAPDVAAAARAPAARVIEGPPIPERVGVDEATEYEMVTTVKAAALKERTNALIPSWLMAVFVVIPLIAVYYITVNSNGPECGEAGQLATNFRGELVNCDLSAYEGRGGPGGGDGPNYVALGQDVYVNVASCAACHGNDGGGGAGPALAGGAVLGTFSSCADHEQWIALGTRGWIEQVGATYGDNATPAGGGGVMAGFASTLSAEQLLAVTIYERVVFGGEPVEAAIEGCVPPPDGEEPPPEGTEAAGS